jgi:hypothetical protein
MAKIMHSLINLGASEARVSIDGELTAHVLRRDGEWRAISAITGEILISMPHTEIVTSIWNRKGTEKNVSLGVALSKLRQKLLDVPAPSPTTVS